MKYKLTENGVFDTEENLSIPNAQGNRHWNEYQEWLGEGNTPDPIRTREEDIDQQIRAIKNKAAADILAIAPEWKQRNLLAEMLTVLDSKLEGRLTPEETRRTQEGYRIWGLVKTIRAQSDIEEEALHQTGELNGGDTIRRAR